MIPPCKNVPANSANMFLSL
uniref:Uncharacterized protein n=1 Tax=Anguilla anguilla TaxID=7936 RepID=A0A0E9SE86_ANGAN